MHEPSQSDPPAPGRGLAAQAAAEPEFQGLPPARAAIQLLRKRLLDLSKRNGLVNYKAPRSSASSIAVVDELSSQVYRILVTEGSAMRFRPADASVAEAGDGPDGDDLMASLPLPLDDVTPDGELAERHVDTWLQTRLSPERLDQMQRRLSDKVQLIREEQGVNTLFLALGMLHYYESESSTEERQAPLMLVPVELTRTSARARYQLTPGEEDVLLNPALGEYLRHSYGVQLPELSEDASDLDITEVFGEVRHRLSRQPRWRVEDDTIVLASFSFLKFVMFKDLEQHEEHFAEHPSFRLLLSQGGETYGLPRDIAGLDLDAHRPPEQTFEVVDADSSQQRAVAAVVKGHNLVIEGPPGTGKSQTIVNLIANTLAANKTVLFVSEKRAALDVVHRRLQSVGLGTFCLELHSQKASKREVIAELKRSLDETLAPAVTKDRCRKALPKSRAQTSQYVAALHRRHEPLGATVFECIGDLVRVREAPAHPWSGDPALVSRDEFEQGKAVLEGLASAVALTGDVREHPWRDTSLEQVGTLWGDDQLRLRQELMRMVTLTDQARRINTEAGTVLGAAPAESIAALRASAQLADLLDESPGAPPEVLTSEEWNAPPPQAEALISLGLQASRRRRNAKARFLPAVLDQHHADAAAVVEKYQGKLFRMLVPEYRRVRRQWIALRNPSYRATMAEQADHLREVDGLKNDLARLRDEESLGRRLFGRHWHGPDSEWDALSTYVGWVVRFRAACVRDQLDVHTAVTVAAAGVPPGVDLLRELARTGQELDQARLAVVAFVGWDPDHLAGATVEAIGARAQSLLDSESTLAHWTAFLRARQECGTTVAADLVGAADAGTTPYASLPASFRRSFLEAWLRQKVLADPALGSFEQPLHDAAIEKFRKLDDGVLKENKDRLVELLKNRSQSTLQSLQDTPGWSFLTRQFARQRSHAPVRRLLQEAMAPIRAIKPCFMMSPLMVAQSLEPGAHDFDLVIFDEASQLTPQDSIGAALRANQLVVVGDPKQLPPTNFFDVQSNSDAGSVAAEVGLEDVESILEQYMAAGVATARLKWHYRSKHESLIAFSNANIYDFDLFTFPSADTDVTLRGLRLEHVPDGVYLGKGKNEIEARRVVDAVVDHVKRTPGKSLGVGTFNQRQQLMIQDELERRRREDLSLEPFFALKKDEPFFVKNLENLQGDERDVMLLSITYGPGIDGVIRHNFGPINGLNGWRRLNVLVSRARERMIVFTSMRGDQIDPTRTTARGAQLLRDFLTYAERGTLVNSRLSRLATAESPFEREVLAELDRRGIRVVPQVGVGPYRIDIGILDDEIPGRFVCGVECDGVPYHSSETARDRDRLREKVLRGLGWRLHRIWSTDWYKHRGGQLDRIVQLIEQSRAAARAEWEKAIAAPADVAAPVVEDVTPRDPDPPPPDRSQPDRRPRKPTCADYVLATPSVRGAPEEILDAPSNVVQRVMLDVLRVEAPMHEADLYSRVAGAWEVRRVGRRIDTKMKGALSILATNAQVECDGSFVALPGRKVKPRSRADTGIPGERIAPAEFNAAVVEVLASGPRPIEQLVADTRNLLGFERTGPKIEACLRSAVAALLAEGRIGYSGSGLALRDGPATGADR